MKSPPSPTTKRSTMIYWILLNFPLPPKDATDTVKSTANATKRKVQIPATTTADSPAEVRENFEHANPSPRRSNKDADPINDLSPDPTLIEYFFADEDNPSDNLSAKDTTSSDDLTASQSFTIHSPADDKNSSARKELKTECKKSTPASRN